uniref:Uncharacterized protein n=1 Tax=Tetradesmus obliquus TaxID=3088 RepID=A0A383VPB3_TETOB|eukprot:jgi/Sobl393_1/688/SZX67368.1
MLLQLSPGDEAGRAPVVDGSLQILAGTATDQPCSDKPTSSAPSATVLVGGGHAECSSAAADHGADSTGRVAESDIRSAAEQGDDDAEDQFVSASGEEDDSPEAAEHLRLPDAVGDVAHEDAAAWGDQDEPSGAVAVEQEDVEPAASTGEEAHGLSADAPAAAEVTAPAAAAVSSAAAALRRSSRHPAAAATAAEAAAPMRSSRRSASASAAAATSEAAALRRSS